MSPKTILWIIFGVIVVVFLVLDLGLFNRKVKKISVKFAGIQVGALILVAMVFGFLIYRMISKEAGFEFFSAYLTEYALSIDNIFVFILILRFFNIPEKLHHKVLYYGIFGAMFFRAIFISIGSVVIEQFHWVLYFFGAFLIYTGLSMISDNEEDQFDANENWFYKNVLRRLRISDEIDDGRLFRTINGKFYFTMLFIVIAMVETSDIIFAVDSIPAVFSITQDPFVVYTSNIFAILGLRALFFLLEGIVDKFHLLSKGISLILVFIGLKMLLTMVEALISGPWYEAHLHIGEGVSFGVIVGLLAGSILLSLVIKPKPKAEKPAEVTESVSPSTEASDETKA